MSVTTSKFVDALDVPFMIDGLPSGVRKRIQDRFTDNPSLGSFADFTSKPHTLSEYLSHFLAWEGIIGYDHLLCATIESWAEMLDINPKWSVMYGDAEDFDEGLLPRDETANHIPQDVWERSTEVQLYESHEIEDNPDLERIIVLIHKRDGTNVNGYASFMSMYYKEHSIRIRLQYNGSFVARVYPSEKVNVLSPTQTERSYEGNLDSCTILFLRGAEGDPDAKPLLRAIAQTYFLTGIDGIEG